MLVIFAVIYNIFELVGWSQKQAHCMGWTVFLFIFQLLYRREQLNLPQIKKNHIIFGLVALFGVFLASCIFSVDLHFSLWGSPYRGGGFINFAFYKKTILYPCFVL